MARSVPFKFMLAGLALLTLYVLAVDVRRTIYTAQPGQGDGPLPFTLESALHFRLLELFDLTHTLPEHDKMVEFPDGVTVSKTYSVGSEYIYVPMANLLPRGLSFQERIRWTQVLWFSTGVVWMALWARWAFGSWWGGAAAGLFYAVSIASVMRSTGQEISRENFALPLLIAFLALDALHARASTNRGRWAALVLASVALAGAMMTWDLIQVFVYLWILAALVHSTVRGFDVDSWTRRRWWVPFAALLVAGVLHPYLRAHRFATSPAMLIGLGLSLALILQPILRRRGVQKVRWILFAAALLPLLIGMLLPGYGETYGHFSELLSAKIRFLNSKPADPALLTFNQRIMWVPALHSADWNLVKLVFPASLWLTCGACLLCLRSSRETLPGRPLTLLVFFAVSLASFIFFVRFHVFTMLFAAALLGWAAAWAARRKGWPRWLAAGLLVVGLLMEAHHTLDQPARWGRMNVYYQELEELTEWMRENVAPEPVLANFGVSGTLLGYAGCPIVLHPKFETAAIRQRVRDYGETLFKDTEKAFRDWADRYGAGYYVYSVGEFSRHNPELQMRYFVDALTPPEYAAARLFEFRPDQGRYFKLVFSNLKYRVFRIVSSNDEALADMDADEAEKAFQNGDLDRAETLAGQALQRDPYCEKAMQVMKHVVSLKNMGFQSKL